MPPESWRSRQQNKRSMFTQQSASRLRRCRPSSAIVKSGDIQDLFGKNMIDYDQYSRGNSLTIAMAVV